MKSEICALAREACNKHDDIDDGVQYCWQRTRDDKKLFRSIAEQLVRNAFREAIYDIRHRNLTRLKFPPQVTTRGPEAIALLADVAKRSFLNAWTTPDNRLLGDCLGGDLPAFADAEFKNMHGHEVCAKFYQAVSNEVASDKLVRDSLSDGELTAIWNSILGTTGLSEQAG